MTPTSASRVRARPRLAAASAPFVCAAALLTGWAFFAVRGPALAPAYATYRDSLNLYLFRALADPGALSRDPVAPAFRAGALNPAGREYAYFSTFRVLQKAMTLNAALKTSSFLLALIAAFFFFATARTLLPDAGAEFAAGLLALILFLSMDSFYFGQNRSFGAALCAAWFYSALSGRGWTSPAFVLLLYLFYPFLCASALVYSLLHPLLEPEVFRKRRAAWAALLLTAAAAAVLLRADPGHARDLSFLYAYKARGLFGGGADPLRPVPALLYFVLNLNEHPPLFRLLLPAMLALGGYLLARGNAATRPFLARLRGLAAAHAAAFVALYPFSPIFASRQLIFLVPFAAAFYLAAAARARWGAAGLNAVAAAALAAFVVLHPGRAEVDDFSAYRGAYEALASAPADSLTAGPASSAALSGAPLYAGRAVYFSTALTEAWAGRLPSFDFSGRAKEQSDALCSPSPDVLRGFARRNGVTHFLVDPAALARECAPGGPAPALLALAPGAASAPGGVMLVSAQSVR